MRKHCYVIGGGPSLIGFDFSALPAGYRIGANRAAWLANCNCFVTVDVNFHRYEAARIAEFGANAHVALSRPEPPIPGICYWQLLTGTVKLATAPGVLAGSNSGFAALNLAVQMGFREIALLGFDMRWIDKRSHFHEGYDQLPILRHNLTHWAAEFDLITGQLHELGVSVTNFVGPFGSMITAFPTAPLDDLF